MFDYVLRVSRSVLRSPEGGAVRRCAPTLPLRANKDFGAGRKLARSAGQRRLQASAIACTLASAFMFTTVAHAQEPFASAVTPDDIDWARTRQFVDGKPGDVFDVGLKKLIGFHEANGNWGWHNLNLGEAKDGKPHKFQLLLALKKPVEIGSIAVSKADPDKPAGSQNGGAVALLKEGAAVPENGEGAAWETLNLSGPAPYLRFAPLSPGTKTQAILYTDIRDEGTARLGYLRLLKGRLFNAAPLARGFAEAPNPGNAVPQGLRWSTDRKKRKISAADPAALTLTWDKPQNITGVFFYSNAEKYRLLAYNGTEANPALAAPQEWQVIIFSEKDEEFRFDNWSYDCRWLSFAPLTARALKLEVTGLRKGGGDWWISGPATFTNLGIAPAPQQVDSGLSTARGGLKISYSLPVGGEATMVINAGGKRVRNWQAQLPREAGKNEDFWDLKDDSGRYVAPGKYQLRGIAGPLPSLIYQLTPYPNVQQLWPDRVPWMTGHDSPNGWLSDHSINWGVAVRKDRVYFGSSMAEAGVTFIECDLDGKKLWGKHDFDPWQGVYLMAADDDAVYVDRHDLVFRVDAATRKTTRLFEYGKNPTRRGTACAMAAHGGKVALSFTGEKFLDNAVRDDEVDLNNCLPKPAGKEFLRAVRATGTPPGRNGDPNAKKPQGNGNIDIESTFGADAEQFAVIAFKNPVPIGSLTFPAPDGVKVEFSTLRDGAPFPPRPREAADWTMFEAAAQPGWNCLPAPQNTSTRALRIKFTRLEGTGEWFAQLEGLKILRRRFENVFSSAKVRVSSGAVDKSGAWDAQRAEAVWHDKPGVYLLEWDKAQKLSGLALKEVNGAVTEIDVWQGPLNGTAPMDAAPVPKSSAQGITGWVNIATYKPVRRTMQYNDNNNRFARYVDGYVDFRGEIETRAVRLRITEPWLDNGDDGAAIARRHDGRSEHGLHYSQSYALKLDSRACEVLGVAPLKYLRGEPALDPLTYERIEIHDGNSGALLKELPFRPGWHGLSFSKTGELYAINAAHDKVQKVNLESGAATTILADAAPSIMTVGPDDRIYLVSHADNGKGPIHVYDLQGKFLRHIGKPGGFKPGPWDPERLGDVFRFAVDSNNSLWVVEKQDYPRRIVQFKTDGTFVKEILGNTHYGGTGGGTLNRYDKTRAYYGPVEFEINWQNHTSRIRGLLCDEMPNGDIIAQRVPGRDATYLVSAPLSLDARQNVGHVYLYDEKSGTARLVAAVGEAKSFGLLRNSAVISSLNGGVPRDYSFAWSDRNSNGQAEVNEVQFEKKQPRQSGAVGRFDETLSTFGNGVRYSVKEFLPDGTPIFGRMPVEGAPHFKLRNGSDFYLFTADAPDGATANFVKTPQGEKPWSYPSSGGVAGLGLPQWKPGLSSNEFAIIGHESEPQGLGEFLVTHANTGQWKIWTADGLFATQILLHKFDKRAQLLGPTVAPPGTRLDPLSASQEHFHGFFTKSEADGKYYIVMGFTNMSLIEVGGLDKLRRFETEFEVTAADIERAQAAEAMQKSEVITGRALLMTMPRAANAPKIDGKMDNGEWASPPAMLNEPNLQLRVSYDEKNLYFAWQGSGSGPLKNGGTEFQRLFKTGAALDVQIAANPQAPATRTQAAGGDARLLFTMNNGKPTVVLYQPIAPGAAPGEAWETFTQAGGKTTFQRVAVLNSASFALSGDKDFSAEAAVPLEALGFKPQAGTLTKFDFGILTSPDGRNVKQRAYWANSFATGTADEAIEARLEPHLWGNIRIE